MSKALYCATCSATRSSRRSCIIDFLRASADRKLRVHVPLHFINESLSRGVKQQGGVVSRADRHRNRLFAQRLAGIHRSRSVDLGMGDALHLSDLKLPDGVELANHVAAGSEQDAIVVSIHHAHGGEEAPSGAPARQPPNPDPIALSVNLPSPFSSA
jgi:large subunit ribosomal protein L25